VIIANQPSNFYGVVKMNRLANIPVHIWYYFSVVYCYAIWNPFYSMWDFVQGSADPAWKAIAIILALCILALYLVEGHRSMNIVGIVLFLALIGSIMWLGFNYGIRFSYIDYWGQLIVALLMTIALQGGRIYRALTGRVPVGTGNVDVHSDHHS
jgi:hypothetical protein